MIFCFYIIQTYLKDSYEHKTKLLLREIKLMVSETGTLPLSHKNNIYLKFSCIFLTFMKYLSSWSQDNNLLIRNVSKSLEVWLTKFYFPPYLLKYLLYFLLHTYYLFLCAHFLVFYYSDRLVFGTICSQLKFWNW